MSTLARDKQHGRSSARGLRALLHAASAGAARQAAGRLLEEVSRLRPAVVAGYLPLRDEIDPRPAMLALHGLGFRLCVPVVTATGAPLRFRVWTPTARLGPGRHGTTAPVGGDWLDPDMLIVPLLAFDAAGNRLGYGGGYFDRTIAALRAERPVRAIGLAYAGQRVEGVPVEGTDSPLDLIVTEAGIVRPGAAAAP